ncbi:hypothetical protein HMPREF1545_01258 [Oscillibacter sp. KLE 1728]|nr:hypothetical protein HMPREF1545_01258 [Oscillibacter sp. KLE 1728]ERK64084.1 hypothetical protein HMPREF1546_01937 [Oscillibacter sp. KLE 1745]
MEVTPVRTVHLQYIQYARIVKREMLDPAKIFLVLGARLATENVIHY